MKNKKQKSARIWQESRSVLWSIHCERVGQGKLLTVDDETCMHFARNSFHINILLHRGLFYYPNIVGIHGTNKKRCGWMLCSTSWTGIRYLAQYVICSEILYVCKEANWLCWVVYFCCLSFILLIWVTLMYHISVSCWYLSSELVAISDHNTLQMSVKANGVADPESPGIYVRSLWTGS